MNKKAFISLVMIALALTLLVSACGNSKGAATTEPPQVIIITATPESPQVNEPSPQQAAGYRL